MQSRAYRTSRHREALLRALREAGTHLSADELYHRLRSDGSRMSFGTVYRNLRILKEQGLILELESKREGSRFDANLAPHAHFSCVQCGAIEDVDVVLPKAITEELARRGLEVTGYQVSFSGRCARCRNATP